MESIIILGVPFFNKKIAKERFNVDISEHELFTDLGMTQVFLCHVPGIEGKHKFSCLIRIEGTHREIHEFGSSQEEALQKTLDIVRSEVLELSKAERALRECYSSFDVPTRKTRISILP